MAASKVEGWLLILQVADVVFLLAHDWVPLGRLSNLEAVREIDTPLKSGVTTVLSALPFILGLVFSLSHRNDPQWPGWVAVYLRWAYGLLLLGALQAWWIPYLLRPDPVRAERYRVRFAGTVRWLPERNGISPDVLHSIFHAFVLATLVLAFVA